MKKIQNEKIVNKPTAQMSSHGQRKWLKAVAAARESFFQLL